MNENRRSFASQYCVTLSLSLSLTPWEGGGALLGSTPTHQHLARPMADPVEEEVDESYVMKVCEIVMAMARNYTWQ